MATYEWFPVTSLYPSSWLFSSLSLSLYVHTLKHICVGQRRESGTTIAYCFLIYSLETESLAEQKFPFLLS